MTRCKNLLLFTFLGGTLMLAQACNQGSSGGRSAPKTDRQDAINVDIEKDEPELIAPAEEPLAVPVPPAGGPLIGEIPGNGPGYGGGSQGALPPLGLDDEETDDDGGDEFEEPIPHGICGNGIKEVLPSTNGCKQLLYGATINQNSTSTLVFLDKNTGVGTPIGQITNIYRVDAIDFSPEGQLYGVGYLSPDDDDDNQFIEIDCNTGEATVLGPTHIEDAKSSFSNDAEAITDIDFNSNGQLWAFLENERVIGTLNVFDGLFTQLTPISTYVDGNDNDDGDGLAFFPWHNELLYNAGNENVVFIDQSDGTRGSLHTLTFPSDLVDPLINAIDNDPLRDIAYASFRDADSNTYYLGRINFSSGVVSYLTDEQSPAPAGLNALAVNRQYEECDGSTEVPGAICIECILHEIDCADNIDDDFDGLTDCEDFDCIDQPCSSEDLCITNSTCQIVVSDRSHTECIGTPISCNDHNPCTLDTCEGGVCSNGVDVLKLGELGSCEEDGRACTVGKCAYSDPNDSESLVICAEIKRELVAGPLGCDDLNECTADSCSESWVKEGYESNGNVRSAAVPWGSQDNRDENGNVLLDNDWQCLNEVQELTPCLDENTCLEGSCAIVGTGMPGDPFESVCQGSGDPTDCSADNTECVVFSCEDGSCVSETLPDGTTCEPADPCFNKICQGGVCMIDTDKEDCGPPLSVCTLQECVPDVGCQPTPLPDGTETGRGFCTIEDNAGICRDGSYRCINGEEECQPDHTPQTEICNDDLDNDCDTFVDCDDPDCEDDSLCRPRIVFLTRDVFTGNFGGIAQADAACQSAAASEFPGRIFKAWISDTTANNSPSQGRFVQSGAPYVLPNGVTVADDYSDLIDGSIQAPIDIFADGTQLPANGITRVWTSTTPSGDVATTDTLTTCLQWQTGFVLTFGLIGNARATNFAWTLLDPSDTDNSLSSCAQTNRLYCFEQ